MATTRYVVSFTGNVQGVGFRMTCIMEASGLPVHGFVRNEVNGSVTMDIDASPADAKELIRRIKIARKSYIDNVFVDEQPSLDRDGGFQIKS